MAKNRKTPDMNLPVWFDGQNINEALFCEEFLQERRIIFANGAFFTPDGRVTDDLPLRGEIYDKLKFCAVNNIPRKITNILEVLKLEAQVSDFPPDLIAERIGLVSPGNVLSEWVCRSSHMGVSRRTASVSADKHNIVPLCVLVNIPGKKKILNKRFVETSAFAKILNCSVGCSVVQGQVERCGRCCGGFALSLAAFAGQELDSFGKGFSVKLHDKINGIAALALAVAKQFVSPDGQAVMFFPSVFPSAFDKCLLSLIHISTGDWALSTLRRQSAVCFLAAS